MKNSSLGRLVLAYAVTRMALFAVAVVVLTLLGLRGFTLLFAGLIVSLVAAVPLSRGLRGRIVVAWNERQALRDAR